MNRPPLRLIHHAGELPQMINPEAPEPYPPDLLQLTDRLHDAGFNELGKMVLDQFLVAHRLTGFCEHLLEVTNGTPRT